MVDSGSNKVRRNISLERELDDWLGSDVNNASRLISDLLHAYRAYGGEEMELVRQYVLEKRLHDTANELDSTQ